MPFPVCRPSPLTQAIITCLIALTLLAPPASGQLKVDSAVIRGTVTAADGGALDSVEVSLRLYGKRTWTDKTGRYRLVVDAGNGPFRMSFVPATDEYAIQWLGGAVDPSDSETVSVAAGDTVEVNVTLERSPVITGVVTGPDGQPMPEVGVTIRTEVTSGTFAETDASGWYSYRNKLPRSPIRVLFEAEQRGQAVYEWFQDAENSADAWPIPLRPGDTVRVDATLPALPPPLEAADDAFTLGGIIRQSDPIPNAEVSGWWVGAGEPDSGGGGEVAFQTFTDEFGWFDTEIEPRNDSLKILFSSRYGAARWYDGREWRNADDWADAVPLATSAGEAREIVGNLDPDDPTARVEVTVTDRDGNPISGLDVQGWFVHPLISDSVFATRTDDRGAFSWLVPSGSLSLQYRTDDGTEIWRGGGSTFEEAERIAIRPGDSLVLRDTLALESSAVITGMVTDEQGNPMSMGVGIFSDAGMIRHVATERGRYRVRIPTEDQPIHLWIHDYYGLYGGIEKWHADGSSQAEATAVAVEPGQEVQVDVSMWRPPVSWGGRDALGGRDARDVLDEMRGDDPGGDAGGDLEGTWVRRDSNNPRNDGMRISLGGSQAVLTYLPPSGADAHRVGQVQWRGLGGGTLRVRGSDGQYYAATLTREGPDVVHIDVSANGPGNDQTWERGGPNVDGDWVRVADPDNPLDGVQVRVQGEQGVIRYLPPTASRLRVGQPLWTNIGAGGAAKVIAPNGAYMDGSLSPEGDDVLRVTVTGLGETQLWARPEAEQRVRSGQADLDLEEAGEGESEDPWATRRGVVNLMTAEAVSTLQSDGDEPWLSVILFTFRFDDIITIDMDDTPAISPLPVGAHPRSVRGNNYFKQGEVHPIGIASYPMAGIQPLTAFGLVPVIIEQAKRGSERERDEAAACIESQVFRMLRELDDVVPDYGDRSADNAREVAQLLVERMDELAESLPTLRNTCNLVDKDRLFTPDLAYWIHAPEVDDATLTDWINEAYEGRNLPLFLDDSGTYRMRPYYGPRQGLPGTVSKPPVEYYLLGNLRLMGY